MRLLVNRARGSALQAENDEVLTYWTKNKSKYNPVLHKKSDDGKCHVIVIHPNHGKSDLSGWIEDIVNENDFGKVGVLYHNPKKKSVIENNIRSFLPDVEFQFIENYSEGPQGVDDYKKFYVPLARACKNKDDFSEEFDALWNRYSPDESLEIKLNLLHELLVPPATEEDVDNLGESLMEGVRNDPEASDENLERCEEAWEIFINANPRQYSDDPFDEAYCGSEDEEGILEELRDGLLATAS